jgi:predicted NBD/HSP70 family sugar kinase
MAAVSVAKPSLDLVRAATDERVLRALMSAPRLTRAEIAARIDISKPTASESVRRLSAGGSVVDTGERTSGRGRIGSYFALADGAGAVLVADIAPAGVVAEALDPHGRTLGRAGRPHPRPAGPEHVAQALLDAAAEVVGASAAPVLRAVVSAADPVDRASGRLVHLPDAPFLVGELSPPQILAPLLADGSAGDPADLVVVDNDVNWAARAEHAAAPPAARDDFAYLHLGEGLGCALVSDGEVRRGHHGLSGEIAHLVTVGPGGRAMPFTQVFAELGLRRSGSTALDEDRLLAALSAPHDDITTHLARAICGVISALIALADPSAVVIGGRWGAAPPVRGAVEAVLAGLPRAVPVRAPTVTAEPALTGVRRHALDLLRSVVVARSLDATAARRTRTSDPDARTGTS